MTFVEKAMELGHRLYLNEKGEVNLFRMDDNDHNGPECERCGLVWCHHCGLSQLEPCSGQRTVIHSVRRFVTALQVKSGGKQILLQEVAVALNDLAEKHELLDVTIYVSTEEMVKS